jgi:sigma-B regulation protein RsbU (phosphoserine phosphatase)
LSEPPPPSEDLADLYDHAPCGYLSLSPAGEIVKVNKTLLRWLGQQEQHLLGRPVHGILSFGGKIAFETHLAPLLRLQGFVDELALDLVDTQGSKIPVIANAAERRGGEGEHLFTRLTVFKAVDRRKFERTLIEARSKAEAEARSGHVAAELRDQFIAVLGHDLRNPLAAIGAGTFMLRRSGRLEGRDLTIIEEMERSAARANRLIDDVMDFARGKLGEGLPLQIDASVPLGPVIEHVVAEMRAIHPGRAFELRLDVSHPVECDPDRIGRLASNLLANAVTHGAPDAPIVCEARTTGESFEFAVSNGGARIPEDMRERLFQPFFRGGVGGSQHGLGLGLFIVSEIARAHGGVMDMTSTDEETRFRLLMSRLRQR